MMKNQIEELFKIYSVSNCAHFDGFEVNELLEELKAEIISEVVNKNALLHGVVARYFKCQKCGKIVQTDRDYTRFNCDAYDHSQTHGRCCGAYEETKKP
jgi:uncharacterized C2H2 Zn-finger protein